MFKLNDHVIYPGHGVAAVADIIERTVSGTVIKFLKLNFLFKDMTILVPMYNVANIGIRYPADENLIKIIIKELGKKPDRRLANMDFTPSSWNRRHKDYQVRIQSGDLLDIAKIYRDLMHIAQQKELSFGERTVLQIIEDLLVQELRIVKCTEREMIIHMLRNPFKQFLFQDRSFLQETAS